MSFRSLKLSMGKVTIFRRSTKSLRSRATINPSVRASIWFVRADVWVTASCASGAWNPMLGAVTAYFSFTTRITSSTTSAFTTFAQDFINFRVCNISRFRHGEQLSTRLHTSSAPHGCCSFNVMIFPHPKYCYRCDSVFNSYERVKRD